MLLILFPGRYEGNGTIAQAELSSCLTFTISWEIFEPKGESQTAIQIISITGAEEPIVNEFQFYRSGEIELKNSVLGESKGIWTLGDNHISWQLNRPPLFEGFELIKTEGTTTFYFYAEYISDSSRNEIKGTFERKS